MYVERPKMQLKVATKSVTTVEAGYDLMAVQAGSVN